jgi:hypothetical protein
MSHQLALCARVVKTGQIAPVLNYGITLDDFTQLEAKNFWGILLGYHNSDRTRGAILGEGTLQSWFKELVLYDMPGMTTEALCYEVRRARVVAESNAILTRYTQEVSVPLVDPAPALARIHNEITHLISLGTQSNTDIGMSQGITNVLNRIGLAQSGVDLSKLKWPWDPLQSATFGLQPDDYVIFYGRPKSMKTWVLCFLISWAFDQQKKIIVYTKEMTPDNIYMRTLACLLRFAYDDLREATAAGGKMLSDEAMEAIFRVQNTIQTSPDWMDLLTVLSGRDVASGGDTVSWLDSKVDKYRPSVAFIDGLYLLSDTRKATSDHVRVMNISRDVRSMVLYRGVPVIASMQANRKAAGHNDANLDEIAYSDALAQDATIAARVINDKASPTISLVIGGSREFKLHGIRINAVPAVDFSFHSILTEKDIEKAKQADAPPEDKKKDKEKVRTNGKRSPKTDEDKQSALEDAQLSDARNLS